MQLECDATTTVATITATNLIRTIYSTSTVGDCLRKGILHLCACYAFSRMYPLLLHWVLIWLAVWAMEVVKCIDNRAYMLATVMLATLLSALEYKNGPKTGPV